MTAFLDLFSGIGGFALGAYYAGLRFDQHYFSEIDEYAIKIYQKHFPEAEPLGDVRNVDYSKLPKADYLVAGGFPCQPFSVAGKKQGSYDKRNLWPEAARVLRELRPSIALFENVPGIFVSNKGEFFNGVLSDLSEIGYDVEWQIISAQEVGAPHLRKRVWIVACATEQYRPFSIEKTSFSGRICTPLAYPQSGRCLDGNDSKNEQQVNRKINTFTDTGIFSRTKTVAYAKSKLRKERRDARTGIAGFTNNGRTVSDTYNTTGTRQPSNRREILSKPKAERFDEHSRKKWWSVEPDVGRVAHGVSFRVDRLKGLGNAALPQCVEVVLRYPAFDRYRISK